MNQYAQQWAIHIASVGALVHRLNNPYGENLYEGWGTNPNFQVNPARMVSGWYKEIAYYQYGTEPVNNFSRVGHATQVLWASSQRLGVGRAKAGNVMYVVCNYDPAGNKFGSFANNVLQPSQQIIPYKYGHQSASGQGMGNLNPQMSMGGGGLGAGAGLGGGLGAGAGLGGGLGGGLGSPGMGQPGQGYMQYPQYAGAPGGGAAGLNAGAGINPGGLNTNLNLGVEGGGAGGAPVSGNSGLGLNAKLGLNSGQGQQAPPPAGVNLGANANLLPLQGQTLISVGG